MPEAISRRSTAHTHRVKLLRSTFSRESDLKSRHPIPQLLEPTPIHPRRRQRHHPAHATLAIDGGCRRCPSSTFGELQLIGSQRCPRRRRNFSLASQALILLLLLLVPFGGSPGRGEKLADERTGAFSAPPAAVGGPSSPKADVPPARATWTKAGAADSRGR